MWEVLVPRASINSQAGASLVAHVLLLVYLAVYQLKYDTVTFVVKLLRARL